MNNTFVYAFRLLLIAADGFVDFVAMDGHFLRGLYTKSYLVAADLDDDDGNIIIDDDTLVLFP